MRNELEFNVNHRRIIFLNVRNFERAFYDLHSRRIPISSLKNAIFSDVTNSRIIGQELNEIIVLHGPRRVVNREKSHEAAPEEFNLPRHYASTVDDSSRRHK